MELITTWENWRVAWENAQSYEIMVALLKRGFSVDAGGKGQRLDRLVRYLNIADGWYTWLHFRTPAELEGSDEVSLKLFGFDEEGNRKEVMNAELRQKVARCAFEELCQNLFLSKKWTEGLLPHDADTRRETALLWGVLTEDEEVGNRDLLETLIHFFQVNVEAFLPALHEKNHSLEKQVREDFLFRFLLLLWNWQLMSDEEIMGSAYKEIYQERQDFLIRVVGSLRPWIVETWAKFERFNFLRKYEDQLDDPCLAVLERLALSARFERYRHGVGRPVATLRESVFTNSGMPSRVASFLLELEIKKQVRKDLEAEIEKAE